MHSPHPVEAIAVTVLYVLAAIYQMLYFLHDDRTPNTDNLSKKYSAVWHATGGVCRLIACWVIGRAYGWHWSFVAAVSTWIWFDGSINTWVLRKEWFYVGTTAKTDRFLRWAGTKLKVDPRSINGAIKALAVVIVLIYLIKTLWT
jgi:hypothetical protein